MTPADLARLHAAAFTHDRPWSEAEFAVLLAAPGAILVHRDRAMALGRVTLDECEVLTVATDPAHRRTGLGRAVIATLLSAACRAGAERAFLEVAADNAAAIALYRATGFAEVGRRKRYYVRTDSEAVDALVLCRALSGEGLPGF